MMADFSSRPIIRPAALAEKNSANEKPMAPSAPTFRKSRRVVPLQVVARRLAKNVQHGETSPYRQRMPASLRGQDRSGRTLCVAFHSNQLAEEMHLSLAREAGHLPPTRRLKNSSNYRRNSARETGFNSGAKASRLSYYYVRFDLKPSSYRGASMHRFMIHVLAAAACVATLTHAVTTHAAERKPNIILILSDDVGLGDIHYTGGHYKTPNIDSLANSGTKFTYCYATPLCGPSRCELLTGRYPFRTGLNSNQSRMAVSPKSEVMIPTVLKKAGYVTGSVGKWGQIQLGPGEWGFDEYLVFPGSGRYWRDQTTFYTENGKKIDLPEGKYLPEIMHKFAVDFIDRHKDKPFFLYYPMSHMHGPIAIRN